MAKDLLKAGDVVHPLSFILIEERILLDFVFSEAYRKHGGRHIGLECLFVVFKAAIVADVEFDGIRGAPRIEKKHVFRHPVFGLVTRSFGRSGFEKSDLPGIEIVVIFADEHADDFLVVAGTCLRPLKPSIAGLDFVVAGVGGWKAPVFGLVGFYRDTDAHRITLGLGPFGRFHDALRGGKQERGKDADDGNHHKKFHEGKSARALGRIHASKIDGRLRFRTRELLELFNRRQPFASPTTENPP